VIIQQVRNGMHYIGVHSTGHSAWEPAEVTFGLPQEQQPQGPVELNKSKSKQPASQGSATTRS